MLDKETRLRILEAMLKIRAFDDAEKFLYKNKELPEYFPAVGRESVAVGVCLNLRQDDMITSTHRGLGHCLAKGMEQGAMLAEIGGKTSGICKGKGGAWHLYDLKNGVIGTYPIVGAGIPIAVGAALSSKKMKTNRVAVSFFSEGASTTGAFHESLNLASVLQVPALFVCENNTFGDEYKQSMKISEISGLKASAYGINSMRVNGEDPEEVYEASKPIIETIRSDCTPFLLETTNPMITASPRRDPELYAKALKMREERDEVQKYTKRIMEERVINENELAAIRHRVKDDIDKAVNFLRSNASVDLATATADIYS